MLLYGFRINIKNGTEPMAYLLSINYNVTAEIIQEQVHVANKLAIDFNLQMQINNHILYRIQLQQKKKLHMY